MRRYLLTVAALLCAAPVAAQTPRYCPYDECALRVKYSLFRTSLVTGIGEERVAGFTSFAPRISLFGERSDSAAYYYASFRGRQNSGTALLWGGAAMLIVGTAVATDNETVGITLSVTGVVALFVGVVQLNRGQDRLSKAVWWYNRTLDP